MQYIQRNFLLPSQFRTLKNERNSINEIEYANLNHIRDSVGQNTVQLVIGF